MHRGRHAPETLDDAVSSVGLRPGWELHSCSCTFPVASSQQRRQHVRQRLPVPGSRRGERPGSSGRRLLQGRSPSLSRRDSGRVMSSAIGSAPNSWVRGCRQQGGVGSGFSLGATPSVVSSSVFSGCWGSTVGCFGKGCQHRGCVGLGHLRGFSPVCGGLWGPTHVGTTPLLASSQQQRRGGGC